MKDNKNKPVTVKVLFETVDKQNLIQGYILWNSYFLRVGWVDWEGEDEEMYKKNIVAFNEY